MQYSTLKTEEALAKVVSDPLRGLSQKQAELRLKQFGFNEITQKKKKSAISLFFNQFKSFIIYILLFAVALSIFSREFVDAAVIIFILLFNAIFGFIQEYKAEKAIDALKKLSGQRIQVIRDGKNQTIEAKELVVGDIILVEEGTKIPADARLIEVSRLSVLESSLTGESNAVSKHTKHILGNISINDQKNMIFSGTLVTSGRGKAVVVATAMQTQIGKIAKVMQEEDDEMTPLQKKLDTLGSYIGISTIVICIIIFFVGIYKAGLIALLLDGFVSNFFLSHATKEWLLVAVSLAVAAVPEGLPAIVTIALAIGVKRMIRRNALIRKLPSVETLGETTVICSDKTGTLTKNEMTVREVWTNNKLFTISGEGYSPEGLISPKISNLDIAVFEYAAACTNASLQPKVVGDPTEAALLVSAQKAHCEFSLERVDEQPFDSERKMMSVLLKDTKGKLIVASKGAPEHILAQCTKYLENGKVQILTPKKKQEILSQNQKMAMKALRVLAIAYRPATKQEQNYEHDLIFVGLQGMIDPPHAQVKDALARCADAGIRVIMITGDNPHTAKAIATEIGISGDVVTGTEFANMTDSQKNSVVKSVGIFARVEPAHKMEIVKILKEQGEVVAMTGDGVNDAPAIKAADIGISMGINGTDVAKEASDMVLVDDNFNSIVNAVEEGRGIFENIKKFVNYLLSCNLGEVLVVFLAIVLGWELPMTAIMLLWMNLITDGLPALALSVDPNPSDLMKKPPKKKSEGIMTKPLIANIVGTSIFIAIGVLLIFWWAGQQDRGYSPIERIEWMQTMAFTAIIVLEIVRLQAIRSEYKLSVFSNWYLIAAVAFSLVLQLLVIYTPAAIFFGTQPLILFDWAIIIGGSILVWAISMFYRKMLHKFIFTA